jgi:hypothetical protein
MGVMRAFSFFSLIVFISLFFWELQPFRAFTRGLNGTNVAWSLAQG